VNWVKLLRVVGPKVLATIPATKKYAPLIIEGIATAEELAEDDPAQKPNKKKIAKEMVSLAAKGANSFNPAKLYDPRKAVEAADKSIDIVVKAVNEQYKK
jgi:hypothetical protein